MAKQKQRVEAVERQLLRDIRELASCQLKAEGQHKQPGRQKSREKELEK